MRNPKWNSDLELRGVITSIVGRGKLEISEIHQLIELVQNAYNAGYSDAEASKEID